MAVDTSEKVNNKIVVVDVSDAVKNQAIDEAEEKLTAAPSETKGVVGFFNRVWKYNLFREYYRQQEIGKAKKGILKTENIYQGTENDKSAHAATMEAVMQRFQSDLNEAIHTEAGETKELLGDSDREKYIRDEIEKSVRAFAGGKIDEANFIEERNRIISSLNDLNHREADKGLMFADNMLEVAKNIRYMVEHGSKLEELDLDFEVIVGKAKMGVRTEAQFNAIDRLTDRISRTKLGSLVNETVVASAMSIGYSLATRASESILRSNVAKIGSFGATAAVSGAITGAKESYRLEEERKKHFRDMAKGKTFNPDKAPRRKRMEEYRYQTISASDLIKGLKESTQKIKDTYNPENVYTLNTILADTEARIKLSDRQKIDLISYSSEKKVEDERFKLDIARAETKLALKEILMKKEGFEEGEADEYINRNSETRLRHLIDGDQGIEQKNRMFRRMKRQKVAGAVLRGTISGLLIGGVIQEAGAFLKSGQEGLIEGLVKGHDSSIRNFTTLEYLRLKLGNALPATDQFLDHSIRISNNTIKLSKGVDLVSDGSGGYNLIKGTETLQTNIRIFPDGKLAPISVLELKDKGFAADQTMNYVTNKTTKDVFFAVPKYVDQVKRTVIDPIIKESDVRVIDFVNSKLGLFSSVHRNIWFDNDTPGIFDKNELRLLWGGVRGSGLDEKGNFILNVKQMLPDGSYHAGFSVDAQKLIAEGKLRLLMSLSESTQNQVVELPFNQNGDVIINKDSEIAKMFFANKDGSVRFLGKFAEVGQFIGKNNDGSDNFNLLATAVGDGVEKIKMVTEIPGVTNEITEKVYVGEEFIKQTIIEESKETVYTTSIGAPISYEWQPPPFIPVLGRRPLERTDEIMHPPVPGPEPIPITIPIPESPEVKKPLVPLYLSTRKNWSYNSAREYLKRNMSKTFRKRHGIQTKSK